ncbi:META domain-containing protein [Flavobacterium sp. Fl-318]|uniref:META domain-containing protein n=1 Tax=Flavobacterium cupriresistens TaxID=2893885 RepID=A0ABU4R5S1_9FLAO|nr:MULTISPECIES: META domain-containing protein [unclassified Flavobacterium]MDX6187868.1 META domain-containing protein [Flavobacterium sp. Fl-318]UFH42212.1 META domain-containing protein [Flavobacterium sp. F-323]
MKKYISVLVLFGLMLSSCNVFKCKKEDTASKLEGTWELNYISGPKITFEGLYPNGKPTINFDLKEKRVSGSNSCNNFNGKLSIDGNKIDFTQPMAVTKKMCTNNQGEQTFMSTLPKITSYDITDEGKTLHFISGDIAMMRFTKK